MRKSKLRDQFEDQLPELIDRELESTRDEREEQLAERKLEEMIERLEDEGSIIAFSLVTATKPNPKRSSRVLLDSPAQTNGSEPT